MKKKFASGMNVGTSSILVTFVLLCLVCFAALSFLSANSDYNLSKQTAERTQEYYQANAMAEIYMADVEALLSKKYSTGVSEKDFYASISSLFNDIDAIEVEESADGPLIRYRVDVGDKQYLNIVLVPNYPTKEDTALFHISSWQVMANPDYLNSLEAEMETEERGLLDFE